MSLRTCLYLGLDLGLFGLDLGLELGLLGLDSALKSIVHMILDILDFIDL